MIQEFFESLITPVTREARQLGYLYESIALQRRYRRHRRAWREHIEKCRTQSSTAARGARTIAVLGSGPLLEVPIEEFVLRAEKVSLIDFVHPREVRAKWGRHPKVEFIETDLLGIASALLTWKGGPLPEPRPPRVDADFVLSANCLSQLALKPREFLSNRVPGPELDNYSERLSAAHLASLRGKNHLVIADYETRVLDSGGEVLEKSSPFFNRADLRMIASWNWPLAPAGEIYRKRSVEMSAGAFIVL